MPFPSTAAARPAQRRAFTLIELLVVIAVISTLLGILAPALGGARIAVHRAACASMQRQLCIGLIGYTMSNDGWIPGYNTSGRALWDSRPDPAAVARLSRSSAAPIQVNDWMSPTGIAADNAIDRNHRFYRLLEDFSDPAMNERVPAWTGGGEGSRDMADWLATNAPQPARGVSYLMPALFQLFGGPRSADRITLDSSAKFKELRKQHDLPANYRPRVDLIGAFARKVAFADGFRYVSYNEFDSDFSYHASNNWGCFTDRTPCSIESTPWGYRGGDGAGFGVPLSYRHAGEMNAAFWDGHVQSLTQGQSRHPAIWAPRGSTFVGRRTFTYAESFDYGYTPSSEDPSRSRID